MARHRRYERAARLSRLRRTASAAFDSGAVFFPTKEKAQAAADAVWDQLRVKVRVIPSGPGGPQIQFERTLDTAKDAEIRDFLKGLGGFVTHRIDDDPELLKKLGYNSPEAYREAEQRVEEEREVKRAQDDPHQIIIVSVDKSRAKRAKSRKELEDYDSLFEFDLDDEFTPIRYLPFWFDEDENVIPDDGENWPEKFATAAWAPYSDERFEHTKSVLRKYVHLEPKIRVKFRSDLGLSKNFRKTASAALDQSMQFDTAAAAEAAKDMLWEFYRIKATASGTTVRYEAPEDESVLDDALQMLADIEEQDALYHDAYGSDEEDDDEWDEDAEYAKFKEGEAAGDYDDPENVDPNDFDDVENESWMSDPDDEFDDEEGEEWKNEVSMEPEPEEPPEYYKPSTLDPQWQLVDDSGKVVKPGDTVTDHRGDTWEFSTILRAPGKGSTGKIIVDGNNVFYPQVFGLKIVRRSENKNWKPRGPWVDLAIDYAQLPDEHALDAYGLKEMGRLENDQLVDLAEHFENDESRDGQKDFIAALLQMLSRGIDEVDRWDSYLRTYRYAEQNKGAGLSRLVNAIKKHGPAAVAARKSTKRV